jgi:predicted DNA-binding transcriptional regulator AlpA
MTAGENGMERLLSVDDAADVLGTSVPVPEEAHRPATHPIRPGGPLVRIPESAVREYIQMRTVEPIDRRRSWQAA